MRLALAAAVFLLVTEPGWADIHKAKACSYFDLDKDVDARGPCTLQDTTVNGHFAYVMTFKNKVSVIIEYVDSQSGAHSWMINGSPGMGFEVNRDNLIGGSSDLKKQVSWQN